MNCLLDFCGKEKKYNVFSQSPDVSYMMNEPLLKEDNPSGCNSETQGIVSIPCNPVSVNENTCREHSISDNEIYIVSRDILELVNLFKKEIYDKLNRTANIRLKFDMNTTNVLSNLFTKPPDISYTMIMKYEDAPSYPEMMIPVQTNYINEDVMMYSVNICIDDYM